MEWGQFPNPPTPSEPLSSGLELEARVTGLNNLKSQREGGRGEDRTSHWPVESRLQQKPSQAKWHGGAVAWANARRVHLRTARRSAGPGASRLWTPPGAQRDARLRNCCVTGPCGVSSAAQQTEWPVCLWRVAGWGRVGRLGWAEGRASQSPGIWSQSPWAHPARTAEKGKGQPRRLPL